MSILENIFANSSSFEEYRDMANKQGFKVKDSFKPKYNELKGLDE